MMKVSELPGRPVHKVRGHRPVHGQPLEVPDLICPSLGSFLLLLPRGTSHSGSKPNRLLLQSLLRGSVCNVSWEGL